MLVGPPSSGKSEALRLLDGVADAQVADLIGPGLLSLTRGRNPRATGLLTRIGSSSLVIVSDLSSLLANADRGAREGVFALLRGVFDGRVHRDLGNADQQLVWTGRGRSSRP
jgi:hypothetical protein